MREEVKSMMEKTIEVIEKVNDSIARIRTCGQVLQKFEGSARFLIPGGVDEDEYEIYKNQIYIFLPYNPGESFAFVWDGKEIIRLTRNKDERMKKDR
jgi:hypothetical protein